MNDIEKCINKMLKKSEVILNAGKQTNEEWLRQCTTEQLEEELLAWWTDGANIYSEFGLYNREIEEARERIVKWLKEIHQ